jgi:hypothetical protein
MRIIPILTLNQYMWTGHSKRWFYVHLLIILFSRYFFLQTCSCWCDSSYDGKEKVACNMILVQI